VGTTEFSPRGQGSIDFQFTQRGERVVVRDLFLKRRDEPPVPAKPAAGHAEALQQRRAFPADDPAGPDGFVFVQVVPADGKVSPVVATHLRIRDGLSPCCATTLKALFQGSALGGERIDAVASGC